MKRTEVASRLRELEQKYFDLVWIARRKHGEKVGARTAARIRKEMPDEVAALSGDGADWQHGFNSGCLAAFRLAMGLLGSSYEVEFAEDSFPFLDT